MFDDGWLVVPAGLEELPAGAALAGVVADGAARCPRLGQVWRAGGIDEARVAILVRWTAALSAEHAGEVLERLVDEIRSPPSSGRT